MVVCNGSAVEKHNTLNEGEVTCDTKPSLLTKTTRKRVVITN